MFPSAKSVEVSRGGITVTLSEEDRVSAIGKNGRNIKALREMLERHFAVKNIRVK